MNEKKKQEAHCHIAHLIYMCLGQYWDFSLYMHMHFIFLRGHYTRFHWRCKRGHFLVTHSLCLWFRIGNFNSFRDNEAHPVSEGTSTGPVCMVMTYIPSEATTQKNQYVWFRSGSQCFSPDIRIIPIEGGWHHRVWFMTFIQLDGAWYKKIYELW
jgi:hypothetical protein